MRLFNRLLTIFARGLSLLSLALSAPFAYRVSADRLGPGAFMLSLPKIIASALAPLAMILGAVGATLGMLVGYDALRLETRTTRHPSIQTRFRTVRGPVLTMLAGMLGAVVAARHIRRVTAPHNGFAQAFGADWERRLSREGHTAMLQRRWSWRLPPSPAPGVERDVAFATIPGTDRRLLADLWQPPQGVAPSGLAVIYLHGGGYTAFDKDNGTRPFFRHLTSQGHVVMDVSYRLMPETTLLGMQGDVKRAIVWLKRNSARYGVNPQRIVLVGGSAGAHLALLAAYAPTLPQCTPPDVAGEDLSVRGVVAFYGAGDLRPIHRPRVAPGPVARVVRSALTTLLGRWSHATIPVDVWGDEWNRLLLGGDPSAWPELLQEVSPITHVGPSSPPTLLLMGGDDVYVAESGAMLELHHALLTAGIPSVYVEFPRTDHAFDLILPEISPVTHAALYDVDRFLALMTTAEVFAASRSPHVVYR